MSSTFHIQATQTSCSMNNATSTFLQQYPERCPPVFSAQKLKYRDLETFVCVDSRLPRTRTPAGSIETHGNCCCCCRRCFLHTKNHPGLSGQYRTDHPSTTNRVVAEPFLQKNKNKQKGAPRVRKAMKVRHSRWFGVFDSRRHAMWGKNKNINEEQKMKQTLVGRVKVTNPGTHTLLSLS